MEQGINVLLRIYNQIIICYYYDDMSIAILWYNLLFFIYENIFLLFLWLIIITLGRPYSK